MAHVSPVSGVAVSQCGLIATAGYDNQLILWKERSIVANAYHNHLVNSCAFDKDGLRLVTSSSDYSVRIWSVPDLNLLAVLEGHDDDVEMASFSPDGTLVATACRDNVVRIFSVDGEIVHEMIGHEADVISVVWSTDGERLISSGDDGTLRHWDARSGSVVKVQDMGGVEIDTVVFHLSSNSIIAGNDNGELVFIQGKDRKVIEAHDSGVKCLSINCDGDMLLSSSYDRNLMLWRLGNNTIELVNSTLMPPVVWARSATFSNNNHVVMGTFGSSYASYDSEKNHWDLLTVEETFGLNAVITVCNDIYSVGDAGKVFKNGEIESIIGSLCNFLILWKGRVVAGGQLGLLFNADTGTVLYRHHSPLNCAATDGQGNLIIGTYKGEGVRLQAEDDGRVILHSIVQLHSQAVKGIASCGNTIFSVSADGEASFTSSIDGFPIKRIVGAHEKIANGASSFQDGGFVSVSRDRYLRFWIDGDTCARVVATPHKRSIKCVAIVRSEKWVVTGSYDGMLAFYNIEKEEWTNLVNLTSSGISSICAGFDSDSVFVSSYDGHIYWVESSGYSERVCL